MNPSRLLLAAVVACFALAAQAAPALPAVSAAMQATVDAREIAGAVTLVATRDKVVHLEATGSAELASKKPMETDAMFWLASASKVVAGVAVLMLQDEEKLNLSDPVAKYFPAFADLKTPSGKPANLTIADLLTHTSGLADHKRTVYFSSKSITEVVDAYFPIPPMLAEPGERWKYTGIGFDLAGRIIEMITGKPYETFVRDRLFTPLGMKDTTFFPSEAQQRRMAANYAKDRGPGGSLNMQPLMIGMPAPGKFPPHPGGGLFSTASDVGRFGQMLLNRGMLDGKRYLSEGAYKTLTTVHTGDLATGFSTGQFNKVLGWGFGAYVLRAPQAGVSAALSAGSFGHPGACGTHLIVDPVQGFVYVLMIHRPNLPDNFENEPTRALVQAAKNALAKTTSASAAPK